MARVEKRPRPSLFCWCSYCLGWAERETKKDWKKIRGRQQRRRNKRAAQKEVKETYHD